MDDLQLVALQAVKDHILRHVEIAIKSRRADTSATADEHKIGFEAGYRQAKSDLLDAISSM